MDGGRSDTKSQSGETGTPVERLLQSSMLVMLGGARNSYILDIF